MKKLLFLTLFAILSTLVSAQEIRDIETAVCLYENGHALVIQKWDLRVTEGTEWYIPIDNPGKSRITRFRVFENDEEFENEGEGWKSNRSLEQKARRCGIVPKGGGDIELCWGLGSMEDHVFTIYYVIENLVLDFGECDGFHWHFLNDEWSVKPQHASIVFLNKTGGDAWFWTDEENCNVRFWGFGMVGESGLEDGAIWFESSEPFQYRSFFSAMIQFDKGLFSPTVKADQKWEDVQEEAFEGSNYGSDDDSRDFEEIAGRILGYGILLAIAGFIGLILFRAACLVYWRVSGRHWSKKIFGKSKIDGWWRDVPLGGNPTALYSLLCEGDHLVENYSKKFPDLVSAYFLKWIQEGLLKVERDPANDQRVNLRFVKENQELSFKDAMEKKVYRAALEAAGKNFLLEKNEFKTWSFKHDSQVVSWPSEAIDSGMARWQSVSEQERCHAVEFMNFLKDFTIMDQREAPEVNIWKQYMVLAASLGIADKVAKNFEKLFPKLMEDYTRESNMMDTATTYLILSDVNTSSTAMVAAALKRDADRRASEAASRRSSGGGGSISFGGGSGGHGGGHGGGAR